MSGHDWARETATMAVSEFLAENHTNAVATPFVWRAVNEALDCFEDELGRQAGERFGYAVMDGNIPLVIMATRRLAKWHARSLRTREGLRGLRVVAVPLYA